MNGPIYDYWDRVFPNGEALCRHFFVEWLGCHADSWRARLLKQTDEALAEQILNDWPGAYGQTAEPDAFPLWKGVDYVPTKAEFADAIKKLRPQL